MSHQRTQIRKAVATLLDAGTNWNYVYEQRAAVNRDNYPYLMVYVDSESSDVETLSSPFQLYRDLNIVVQGYVRSQDSDYLEDKLDLIASEVETLLTTATLNMALTRRVVAVHLAGTDVEVNYNGDDVDDAVISLGFVIQYQTTEGLPDA